MSQSSDNIIQNTEDSSQNKTLETLAFAVSGALVSSLAAAEEKNSSQDTSSTVSTLQSITVETTLAADENPYAVKGAPYLIERVADPRRTRDLSKTPANINVMTNTLIQESGHTDLKDIVDAQPGITLGTGENGNAFGDRYIIRGHEARSDVFVDGMRDPGMTIRESFAIEQIEISKGPSSTFAGRGTSGGAINSVSKRASVEHDFTKLSAGVGTDEMHRLMIDTNLPINDDYAIRINALHAAEAVPKRSPANRERRGLASSLIYEPTDELQVTLDLYHLSGEDKPDLGTYLKINDDLSYSKPLSRDQVPVYVQNEDFLESSVNVATLRVGYEFDPDTRFINLTRYGTTQNGYVMTGAKPITAYSSEDDAELQTQGYESFYLSTHQGWQAVDYFANQLNFLTVEELGTTLHELVFGLEFSQYHIKNGQYSTESKGTKDCWWLDKNASAAEQKYCGTDAAGHPTANLNNRLNREITKADWDSDWSLNMISLSAMDSMDVSDSATIFAGLRYDHYDYTLKTQGKTTGQYEFEKGVWNGHFGAGYDVTLDLNVYAMYSTASNLNGGESDVGTDGGYGGFVEGGEDEKISSYELGVKWELNDAKLLATASIFRVVKRDVVEAGSDYNPVSDGSPNTGQNQVEGIELGIAGNITDQLSLQAGIALMDSKILESKNEAYIGKPLANFAETSAMMQMRYQITPTFSMGGAATYEGVRYTGQPDSAANEKMAIPDYTILDAFAYYHYNRDLSIRLNINNVADKEYHLAAYRSGSFIYLGDARRTQLTVDYKF